jgi:hypothetical protein
VRKLLPHKGFVPPLNPRYPSPASDLSYFYVSLRGIT